MDATQQTMQRVLWLGAGFVAGVAYREYNVVDYEALEARARAEVRLMPARFDTMLSFIKDAAAAYASSVAQQQVIGSRAAEPSTPRRAFPS